jgi:hypothetical protein
MGVWSQPSWFCHFPTVSLKKSLLLRQLEMQNLGLGSRSLVAAPASQLHSDTASPISGPDLPLEKTECLAHLQGPRQLCLD